MTDTALVGGICVDIRKSMSRFVDAYSGVITDISKKKLPKANITGDSGDYERAGFIGSNWVVINAQNDIEVDVETSSLMMPWSGGLWTTPSAR